MVWQVGQSWCILTAVNRIHDEDNNLRFEHCCNNMTLKECGEWLEAHS
jgi:hypothetical protein